MQSILQITNYHPLLGNRERVKRKKNMYIDVFELTPDNDRPRRNCYCCLGCPHLQAVTVDSEHNAHI